MEDTPKDEAFPSLAKAAAYALQARLAAIVQSSDDAIIGKDTNGVITSWNPGAQRLFGYTADEVIGKSITILIPEERLHEEPQVLSRIRRGESIEHYETIRRRKDGSLVEISLTVSPIFDQSGTKVIGVSKIARDISERVRHERALIEADRRKDEFLATLAHELRNPLAPIRSSLDYLRRAGLDQPVPPRLFETMDRQVNHLVRLVEDLLDVSRISRGAIELRREALNLGAVASEAIELSRPHLEERRHGLELKLPPDALMVHGDRVRLVQVVANLLNNAAKFTPPQGLIRVVLERDGASARLRVADNGIGLSAEDRSRVFEMFTQIRGPAGGVGTGLGIGLSLVRRLVEMHQGRIEVRSEGPGRGAEFVVSLPLVESAALPVATGGKAPPPPVRRVLVVDDNRDAAEALTLFLRSLGHEVYTANGGREALEQAAALRPELVLLDIGMPDMNGYEVARELRRLPWGAEVRLVALSGWGQPSDRQRSAEAGFDEHLVKPVDLGTLDALLGPPGAALH